MIWVISLDEKVLAITMKPDAESASNYLGDVELTLSCSSSFFVGNGVLLYNQNVESPSFLEKLHGGQGSVSVQLWIAEAR